MSLVLTQNVLIIEASASKENDSTLSDGERGVGITWSGDSWSSSQEKSHSN